MPLYECERCHAVENTALTDFWWNEHDNLPKICSECETGTWHGRFPKTPIEEYLREFPKADIYWRPSNANVPEPPK